MGTDMSTDVYESGSFIPEDYGLDQNYPNPFNPETNIKFILPEIQQVTLTIYNLLGQIISIPIKEQNYDAGTYTYKLNASKFPSGIYIYAISTKKYNESRKMLFLR